VNRLTRSGPVREPYSVRRVLALLLVGTGAGEGGGDQVAGQERTGRVVEAARTDRLYATPEMPYTLGLLASIPRMDRRTDRLDPIKQSVLGSLVGSDFVAVHMSWGAANEWSAITAYQRMADLEEHPVLAELLRRIAKQEARHVAFYTSQARERLAASAKARKVTRFALSRFWAPVGSSISSDDDVRHVMTHLMSGPEGRRAARKVDDSISGMCHIAIEQRSVIEFSTVPSQSYCSDPTSNGI